MCLCENCNAPTSVNLYEYVNVDSYGIERREITDEEIVPDKGT